MLHVSGQSSGQTFLTTVKAESRSTVANSVPSLQLLNLNEIVPVPDGGADPTDYNVGRKNDI
jgi:hypothetical protein